MSCSGMLSVDAFLSILPCTVFGQPPKPRWTQMRSGGSSRWPASGGMNRENLQLFMPWMTCGCLLYGGCFSTICTSVFIICLRCHAQVTINTGEWLAEASSNCVKTWPGGDSALWYLSLENTWGMRWSNTLKVTVVLHTSTHFQPIAFQLPRHHIHACFGGCGCLDW